MEIQAHPQRACRQEGRGVAPHPGAVSRRSTFTLIPRVLASSRRSRAPWRTPRTTTASADQLTVHRAHRERPVLALQGRRQVRQAARQAHVTPPHRPLRRQNQLTFPWDKGQPYRLPPAVLQLAVALVRAQEGFRQAPPRGPGHPLHADGKLKQPRCRASSSNAPATGPRQIFTARPGIVIGKKGQEVENMKVPSASPAEVLRHPGSESPRSRRSWRKTSRSARAPHRLPPRHQKSIQTPCPSASTA